MLITTHIKRFTHCMFTALIASSLIACTQTQTLSNEEFETNLALPSLTPDRSAEYQQQMQLVIDQSQHADFDKLRLLFAATPMYKPWDASEHEGSVMMLNAHEDGEFALCLSLAKALLRHNYTSLDGHYGAYACNSELGNTNKSNFHQWVLHGLIDSIRSTGSGDLITSPITVISPNEMRAYIRMIGYHLYQQDSEFVDGKHILVAYTQHGMNDTKKTFYFDASIAQSPF